jgi:periplasmic protein CpxP/Spy
MKRQDYKGSFPATLVVVMVAFLSIIFFANANLSFADSVQKKSSKVARPTAVDYTEAQIKKLHTALMITEAQEPSWNKLTEVMRENAKEMDVLTKDRVEKINAMNAVEQMKFHNEITKTHFEQQNKVIPPFEAFYGSLSDKQKKVADEIFLTGRHGKYKF